MSEEVALVVEPAAVARTSPAQRAELALPRLIVDAGPAAVARFLEFFAARIANRRTRAAYGRAVGQFLAWCQARRPSPQAGLCAGRRARRPRCRPDRPARSSVPRLKSALFFDRAARFLSPDRLGE